MEKAKQEPISLFAQSRRQERERIRNLRLQNRLSTRAINRMEPDDTNHCICIPSEISAQILSYLPVISLLRFRSISKEWKSIIDNPAFAFFHFSRYSKLKDNLASHLLVLERSFHKVRARSFSCCTVTEPYRQKLKFNPPIPAELPSLGFFSVWPVAGDVDGLILLQANASDTWCLGDFVLWNPSIRKSFNIPPPPSLSHKCYSLLRDDSVSPSDCVDLCFGFDPSTNDYKVVNILHSQDATITCEIFSLNSRTWRSVSCPNSVDNKKIRRLTGSRRKKIYLGGYVHWVGRAYNEDHVVCATTFISFNLMSETFSMKGLPPEKIEQLFVVAAESTVGLLTSSQLGNHIWVLQTDGHWNKRYTLPSDIRINHRDSCYLTRGGVLIYSEDDLFSGTIYAYDTTTKQKTVVSNLSPWISFDIGTFEESLVLLR